MENCDLNHITLEEKLALEQMLKEMREQKQKEREREHETVAPHGFYHTSCANPMPLDENAKFMTDLTQIGKTKKAPQLTKEEMNLLEFCHNTDMHKFIKEEFTKNKIDYSKLENDPTWMA